MSVENGCLVFCSSRGDGALIRLNACVLPSIAWFYFFCSVWFSFWCFFSLFSCPVSFGHDRIQSLVFQSHRTSHLVHAA